MLLCVVVCRCVLLCVFVCKRGGEVSLQLYCVRRYSGGGGWCSTVCMWGGGVLLVHNEVLVRNVIHYVPVLLPSHHLEVHVLCTSNTPPPPPHQQPFFRKFKKSTAPYKVHNLGLRYIKNLMFLSFSD